MLSTLNPVSELARHYSEADLGLFDNYFEHVDDEMQDVWVSDGLLDETDVVVPPEVKEVEASVGAVHVEHISLTRRV